MILLLLEYDTRDYYCLLGFPFSMMEHKRKQTHAVRAGADIPTSEMN